MNCKTVGLPEPKFNLQNDTKRGILVVLTLFLCFSTSGSVCELWYKNESNKHKKAR
jgi:hypothetical protein